MTILLRVLLLVTLSLTPALAIQAYAIFNSHKLEKTIASEEALRLLGFLKADLVRVVEGTQQLLVTLAESNEVREAREDGCTALLTRVADRQPASYELHVTDRAGKIICSSQASAPGIDISDRYHVFTAMAEQRFVVGEFIAMRTTGQPALTFAAPYFRAPGQIGGVVTATVLVESLAAEPQLGLLKQGATATVTDRNGVVLASTEKDLRPGTTLRPSLARLLQQPTTGTVVTTDSAGLERVTAYEPPVEGLPNLLLSVSIEPKFLAELQKTLIRSLGLLAVTLVASLAIAAVSYKHLIARPFASLMDLIGRWTRGDYSTRISINGAPELRSLSAFLNGAADAMATRDNLFRRVREAERRMSMVMTSTTDAIIEIDVGGRVIFSNSAARRYLADAGAGERLFWDMPLFSTDPSLRQRCQSAIDLQQAGEFETMLGGRHHAIRAFPSPDGLALFFQDITARKEAESALHQSQQLLSRIINLIPIGIWIADKDGKLVQSNPAGRKIWEGARYVPYRQFDVYKGWWHSTSKKIEPEEWAAARAILHGEVSINEEIDIECFDGSRKIILNSAMPIRDKAGNIVGAFIVNEDVTDRVRERDQLATDLLEAKEANRSKSRFLAAASHDLRQPLQSLSLLFSVLRPQLQGEGKIALSDKIQAALDTLSVLIGDVLEVSRLESGAISPNVEDVHLGSLLNRFAAEYRLRAEDKGLVLKFAPCSLVARSDSLLLERMLRNLIENAIKYTRHGKVLVGCRRREGSVRLNICDTGIGIPPEQLDAIFNEFYQLDNPARDQAHGVGLGLSIVQTLARALGHRLYVRSTVGCGSCFTVELPTTDVAANAVTVAVN